MTASARNRRSIILGGSVIAVILLWVFAIMPFFDRISQREDEIENNVKLIRKYTIALDDASGEGGADADTATRLKKLGSVCSRARQVSLQLRVFRKLWIVPHARAT
jgi:type II secretory pathway component PulM